MNKLVEYISFFHSIDLYLYRLSHNIKYPCVCVCVCGGGGGGGGVHVCVCVCVCACVCVHMCVCELSYYHSSLSFLGCVL